MRKLLPFVPVILFSCAQPIIPIQTTVPPKTATPSTARFIPSAIKPFIPPTAAPEAVQLAKEGSFLVNGYTIQGLPQKNGSIDFQTVIQSPGNQGCFTLIFKYVITDNDKLEPDAQLYSVNWNGKTLSKAKRLSQSLGSVAKVQVVTLSKGALLVWSQENPRYTVLASRFFDGKTFFPPVILSGVSAKTHAPIEDICALALIRHPSQNTATLLWQETTTLSDSRSFYRLMKATWHKRKWKNINPLKGQGTDALEMDFVIQALEKDKWIALWAQKPEDKSISSSQMYAALFDGSSLLNTTRLSGQGKGNVDKHDFGFVNTHLTQQGDLLAFWSQQKEEPPTHSTDLDIFPTNLYGAVLKSNQTQWEAIQALNPPTVEGPVPWDSPGRKESKFGWALDSSGETVIVWEQRKEATPPSRYYFTKWTGEKWMPATSFSLSDSITEKQEDTILREIRPLGKTLVSFWDRPGPDQTHNLYSRVFYQ